MSKHNLHNNIAHLIEAHNFPSRHALAKYAGLHSSVMAKWAKPMSGYPQMKKIEPFARLFGLDPMRLICSDISKYYVPQFFAQPKKKIERSVVEPPSPASIKEARKKAGHTYDEAASVVYRAAPQRWAEWETGRHRMDPAVFELYLIKTGQRPA